RLLSLESGHADADFALGRAAGGRKDPSFRGLPRGNRDRHDRAGPGKVRRPVRRRPGAARPMGAAGRRGPRGGRAGARLFPLQYGRPFRSGWRLSYSPALEGGIETSMKFALLGADLQALQLAAAVAASHEHELVSAHDVGQAAAAVREIAPLAPIVEHWEGLLGGSQAEARTMTFAPTNCGSSCRPACRW